MDDHRESPTTDASTAAALANAVSTSNAFSRPGAGRGGFVAFAVAVAVVAGLSLALHARVSLGEPAAQRQPLPVSTAVFSSQAQYRREVSFIGLVRAGSKSNLGFEVPGALAELPVREGSRVLAGELLAALDTDQLQARRAVAAADLDRVSAELELAHLKAARQKDLQASGAVSEEAFDETRLTARALEAQRQSVQARIRGIDIELEKSVLRAPYDGVVAERLVNTGAVVNAGTPVLRLVASGQREAHVGIAAEQSALLEEGAEYRLVLRGKDVAARLRSIRPDVDPLTLTVTAVFELPSGLASLDGEPVSLRLEETVREAGGWVPMSALLEGERGLWTVLRLKESGSGSITVREAVEVLEVLGDSAYVRGTLVDSQRYIADGVHRIAPGTPVAPREA